MKMKGAQKVHYDTGPNMTPLVDIVMVILIFLMLTGTFAVGEHYLQSNQSIKSKGLGNVQKQPGVPEDEPLEIRVDSFTRPGADGLSQDVWSAQVGGFPIQNNRDQLKEKLNQMREQFQRNGRPPSKVQIVINPGRTTRYKHLLTVYETALDAQFEKVGFSTAH